MSFFSTTARGLVVALAVPAAALVAAPANGATVHVTCVGAPVGVTCDATAASIQAAAQSASNAAGDDLIAVGPGSYSALGANLTGTPAGAVTLQGSGTDTVITMPSNPAGQNYVFAIDADVRDLRIEMTGGADSASDYGLKMDGGSVRNVTVNGPDTQGAVGMTVRDGSVDDSSLTMPLTTGWGLILAGDATATDMAITARVGVEGGQDSGVQRVSRARIRAGLTGVNVPDGDVSVDNLLIDLGTSFAAVGLRVESGSTDDTHAFLTADHVTVVGGAENSRGANVVAGVPTARKSSTLLLSNSVISGPEAAIVLYATNDGNQGGSSEAYLEMSYTDYDPAKTFPQLGANGTGGIELGAGNINAAPGFTDPATGNYLPGPGSPLIEAGNPAAGTSTLDVLGHPRVADGNGDIAARRDIGAYEVPDTFAAQTSAVSGASLTRDRTPTFTFGSEPGATFTCKVDAKPATACTSPYTAPSLSDGTHELVVTAKDATGNADASPSQRSFAVDTVAPATRFVTKPASKIRKARARFTFAAPGAVTFQCRLDAKAWTTCASPKVFVVAKGKHVVRVRGIDKAGNVDLTPSTFRFKRV